VPDEDDDYQPPRFLTALRAWARREPVLVIRTAGILISLLAWGLLRWFDVDIDEQAILAYVGLLLGLDTLVTHESVYSPATVARVAAEAADDALLNAPHTPAPTVAVVEVNNPEQGELDRIVAALKQLGADPVPDDVRPVAPPPAPVDPIPWAPTRIPPPDGLDG
jgi:hypothetical protein